MRLLNVDQLGANGDVDRERRLVLVLHIRRVHYVNGTELMSEFRFRSTSDRLIFTSYIASGIVATVRYATDRRSLVC